MAALPRFSIAGTLLIVPLLATIVNIASASAAVRIALVVGNSDYVNVQPLTNPAKDARLVARTLRQLGFTLVGGGAQLNLNKALFDRAVQDFGSAAQGADVALFYYAGHGLQVNGVNYLVPVDANPHKQADVDFQMLGSDLVLRQMESAHTRLNLVILDACRNNPFGSRGLRSVEGGLAQMQAPEGTLISFATQPGNVALDGNGDHSPFTKALAEVLPRPGLDIFRAFNEVGLMVSSATDGAQQPWVSSSPIKGDFYFTSPPKAEASIEQQRFEAAERIDTKAAWESFLSVHKTGYFADLARAARDRIIDEDRAKAEAEARAKQQAHSRAKVAAEAAAKDEADERARAKADQDMVAKVASAAATKAAQEAAERIAKEITERAAMEKVAALNPPSGPAGLSKSPILNSTDLIRLLKAHLREVGCDPGDGNPEWNTSSRHALEQFNKYAGTHLDVVAPSLATLDVVRTKSGKVCPATHPSRQHAPSSRRTTPAGIVLGSPEHMRLRSECRNGVIDACQALCSAGGRKACSKIQRLSGLGGGSR
jgi:uncharacterized caspase-like protein